YLHLSITPIISSTYFFFLLLRPPPISTLFPYTTLFRSNAVRVPVPPREGLDGGLRVCGVDFRSQDGAVANAFPGRAVERLHGRAVRAEIGISARRHTTARVE